MLKKKNRRIDGGKVKKYCVVFPGQGSQYVGMGKNLYDHNRIAKEVFDEANDLLGYDLKKKCFEGDINELSQIENVQPAILTTSVAAFQVFMQDVDMKPQVLLGHSLGEITALVCAGVIEFGDALRLVSVRGQLMGDSVIEKGIMIAIMGIEIEKLKEICKSISRQHHIVEISNINSEDQIILSGHVEAAEKAIHEIEELGGRSIRINTGNPFHCSLMSPVKNQFKQELLKYRYHDFVYPVISNLDAKPYKGKEEVVERLSEQIVNSVQWKASMDYLIEQEISTMIELSPQSVLRNLILTDVSGMIGYSYDDKYDYEAIKRVKYSMTNDLLASKKKKRDFIQRCISGIVCTKNDNHSNTILQNHQRVKELLSKIEKDDVEPSYEEMKLAFESLIEVMQIKRVTEQEYQDRICAILYETGFFQLFSEYMKWG